MAIQCNNCKFRKARGRSESQQGRIGRKWYFCENALVFDQTDSRRNPQNNFIGYGDNSTVSPLQLKTAPKWCPLKRKGAK